MVGSPRISTLTHVARQVVRALRLLSREVTGEGLQNFISYIAKPPSTWMTAPVM